MPTDDELRKKAEKIAEGKIGFQIHFSAYLAVNAFFIALWLLTPNDAGLQFPWFIIPMFGWGIGILVHYFGAYRGLGYQERIASKEYQRLKELENK